MQTPAPATSSAAPAPATHRPPDRYVVRPAGVLADLLGAAELGEDELLLRLGDLGLITYPSPLLGGLTEDLPEVLAAEVLARLDPTDLVLFGQAGRACRAAVVAFGVPQEEEASDVSDDEGSEGGPLLLRVEDFVGSVERLAWAKEIGCAWDEEICAWAASGGHLDVLKWVCAEVGVGADSQVCSLAALGGHLAVLQWAREHGCDWDEETCLYAARGGHLDLLRWAHEHGCPWGASTCASAARGGHLHVLQWAREHRCEWDWMTCAHATMNGHLEVLKWARDRRCPWNEAMCWHAVEGGNLDVLKLAREHGCPWTAATRDAAATLGYSDDLPLSV